MPIVVMTSEWGTSGTEIATRVASQLNIELINDDSLLPDEIQMGTIATDGFRGGSRISPKGHKPNQAIPAIRHCVADFISARLRRNNVLIHSFVAPYLLHNLHHVPKVLICESRGRRIQRLTAGLSKLAYNHAVRALCNVEHWRNHVLCEYFNICAHRHAPLFDLVADAGWLSATEWADEIVDLVHDHESFGGASRFSRNPDISQWTAHGPRLWQYQENGKSVL